MSNQPDISVVMSVYNGARHLRETVDSILSQQGVSFEFVIVNDGSTDQSREILDDYAARYRHVKVIHQQNQGLTRALIKGCTAAVGKYIVRQDAGDISLPDRLLKQLTFIEQHPDASFVSCGTRYVGPTGEYLYEVKRDPADATASLLTLQMDELRGPSSHPSTIFSKALYERVGGYRAAFYFAQDLDLWIRFAEQGKHVVMPEVLYQTSVAAGSISGVYRREQIEAARLILESARLRRQGLSDEHVLERVGHLKPDARRMASRSQRAKALYFIGMCLRNSRSPQASGYFREALLTWPLHLKSAVRLLQG
jgi:glycosyltransferase involved in cell wall biosynthesis